MEATAFAYHYAVGFAHGPVRGGGNVRSTGGAVVNGPVIPARTGGGTVEAEVSARRADIAAPGEWILHGKAELFTRDGAGTPLATRLIFGCGGRRVPWGILQEVTEVDDSDVQVWTATAGPFAGKAAGVALLNPRVSVSLTAVFLAGTPPPVRGVWFSYLRANGQTARMICLKITHHWDNASFYALQLEGTEWDSPLSRAG
ncbi:MAG: hypothetical protein V4726_11045 [Verrucomicrobiota bacterium]